jgi:hypothetical protein
MAGFSIHFIQVYLYSCLRGARSLEARSPGYFSTMPHVDARTPSPQGGWNSGADRFLLLNSDNTTFDADERSALIVRCVDQLCVAMIYIHGGRYVLSQFSESPRDTLFPVHFCSGSTTINPTTQPALFCSTQIHTITQWPTRPIRLLWWGRPQ